jgi:hypothetical protein
LAVETVKFGRTVEAVDRGGSLTTGIGAGKEIIFSPEGNHAVILPISGEKL